MLFAFHLVDQYSPEEFSQFTLLRYLRETYPSQIKFIDYMYENQYKGILRRIERAELKGEDVIQVFKNEIQILEELGEEENADALAEFFEATIGELTIMGYDFIESVIPLVKAEDDDEANAYSEMVNRIHTSPAYQKLKRDPTYIPIPSEEWLNQFKDSEPTVEDIKKVYMEMYNLNEADELFIQKIYLKIYPAFKSQELLYKLISDSKTFSNQSDNSSSSLRIKLTRKPGDHFTVLSQRQTAYTFKLFQNVALLLDDKALLSDRTLAESIHALTGYSQQTIRNFFTKPKITEHDKTVIIKILDKIKGLINNQIDELS